MRRMPIPHHLMGTQATVRSAGGPYEKRQGGCHLYWSLLVVGAVLSRRAALLRCLISRRLHQAMLRTLGFILSAALVAAPVAAQSDVKPIQLTIGGGYT